MGNNAIFKVGNAVFLPGNIFFVLSDLSFFMGNSNQRLNLTYETIQGMHFAVIAGMHYAVCIGKGFKSILQSFLIIFHFVSD